MADQSGDGLVLIYTTLDSKEEAERIGHVLVEERLAACINLLEGMTAIYAWEGKVEQAREWVMLVKTRKERLDAARARLRELHPYDVPALFTLEAGVVDDAYKRWLLEQTRLDG